MGAEVMGGAALRGVWAPAFAGDSEGLYSITLRVEGMSVRRRRRVGAGVWGGRPAGGVGPRLRGGFGGACLLHHP